MRKFKVIVKNSDNCIKTLNYLNNNVKTINKMGIKIVIRKINTDDFDQELVEVLRQQGITRLPTLIMDSGEKYVGLESIKNIFEKNMKRFNATALGKPINKTQTNEYGNNPDLGSFYKKKCFRELKMMNWIIAKVI